MDDWAKELVEIDFVGGPLDGTHPRHPHDNYYLPVPENPEGVYLYRFLDGKSCYVWTVERHPEMDP